MTSVPASNLSNLKFNPARSEEFGHLRRANTALLLVLVLVVGALSGGAWQVALLRAAVADFKPVYVRINDVGKAEVIYYKDASYKPQAPEVIRALSDFTADFFAHMKGRTDAYWHAKYLLSEPLMQRCYLEDQRSKWIENVNRGSGIQNDVTVKRVTLVSLTPKGGVAYVDLTRSYYDDGVTANRKEDDTVTYYFSFLPKVSGDLLRFNPLGICITDYNLQEDFSTK